MKAIVGVLAVTRSVRPATHAAKSSPMMATTQGQSRPISAIRFTREVIFEATWFTRSLRPARLLAPLYGSDRHSGRPTRAFTSRLSTVGLPPCCWISLQQRLDSFCWRDFHPRERQLASQHLLRITYYSFWVSLRAYMSAQNCVESPFTCLPGRTGQ